jgi:hypothetical protein
LHWGIHQLYPVDHHCLGVFSLQVPLLLLMHSLRCLLDASAAGLHHC